MCPRRTLNLAPVSGCNASADVISLESWRTVFPDASKNKVIFSPNSMEEQVFICVSFI